MSDLFPCPGCSRHVRKHESNCPFCDAELSFADLPAATWPRARLSRAATFAFGATLLSAATLSACGGESTESKKGSGGTSAGGTAGHAGSAASGTSGAASAGAENIGGTSAGSGASAGVPNLGGSGTVPPYGSPPAEGGGMPVPLYGAAPSD